MAITLVGTGGFFTRLGLAGGILNSVNTYRGTTVAAKVDTYSDEFDADKEFIDSLYSSFTGFQVSMNSLPELLRAQMRRTLIDMINLDNPQPVKDEREAVRELIRQMLASVDTINASAVSVSVAAAGTNYGNGTLVASLRYPPDVKLGESTISCENVLAEDIVVDCTGDAFAGTLTAASELFEARGEFGEADMLRWDWPRGSGAFLAMQVVDPSQDAQQNGQLLTNGDFEDFTANAPDNWEIVVGTAGATVDDTATAYRGSKALLLTGNGGAENTRIRQVFNDADGTVSTILPQTIYALHVRMRKTAGLAAGEIRFALTDAAGNVLTDDLSTNCSFSIAHGTLTTSYVAYSAVFVTARTLPTAVYLDIEATTALTNTESVYIDDLALAPMDELYQQGPHLKLFAGATQFAIGDRFTSTVTNTAGGFQRLMDKFFDMKTLNLILPSDDAGGETISDALIT